jgi:hypothetical protein
MEFRYLGFEQHRNARTYRFDVVAKGEPTRHFMVTADLALFLEYRIGIQEGPSLCATKLAADIEGCAEGTHELTADDLRAYALAKAAAEARRAESRRSAPRRPRGTAPGYENSPWRGSRP